MRDTHSPASKKSNTLLIVGILFIAFNLRPALASVGPLVENIRTTTGLSSTMLGLVTSLPLIAFGLMSVLTPLFTRRFGIGGTLLGAMAILTIGIAIRSINWIPALYIGTILAGIGIAFGNVLLPSITKQNFSEKSGLLTSLYSSMMVAGAAVAAGISVPLVEAAGFSWQTSLGVWGFCSFLAFLMWIPQTSQLASPPPKNGIFTDLKKLGRSRLAWQVATFMGTQSLTYYVLLAWLPAILQSRGFDATYSGWMLSLTQLTGIIGTLIFPVLAGKRNDQRGIVLILILLELVGLTGLFFPQMGWVALWVSLLGFVLGGSFGLSLLFIVLRSKDADATTGLSGMAQSVGYLIAGLGPIIFGKLYDLTAGWTYPFLLLLLTAIIKISVGMGAARGD